VAENASAGTDHGTAAPMFLAGGGVRGVALSGLYDMETPTFPGAYALVVLHIF